MSNRDAICRAHGLRRLLWCAVIALTACGGGGGTDGAAPPTTTAGPQVFSGTVTRMGTGHVATAAPAGIEVSLYAIDLTGQPGALLAKTTTSADGSYSLTAPADASPGVGLLMQVTDAAGLSLRSLALGTKVHVGPASETVARAVLAAQVKHGTAFNGSAQRLAKFQRAAVQFLNLMDLNAADDLSAVTELSDWLDADPASREVLTQIAQTGALPASIGDVGGIYRLGAAAWETTDSDGTTETASMVYRPDNGGEFVFYRRTPDDYLTGLATAMTAIVRMTDDGAQYFRSPGMQSVNGNVQLWATRIGQYAMAHFGTEWGVVDTLASVAGQTVGYTYDADMIEDSFTYKLDRTIMGEESIEAGGRTTRALRIDTTETLVVILSQGGEIRSVAKTSSWHVPFVGSVLTKSDISLTDASGIKSTSTSTQTLLRSVVNDMSWPGRIHVQTLSNTFASVTSDFRPIALLDSSAALYMSSDRFMVLNPSTGAVLAESAIPSVPSMAKRLVRVSPDRSMVYVIMSPIHPDQSFTVATEEALASAADRGAWVYRLDARSLTEQLRIQVPPRLSDKSPGRGFAQWYVTSAVVSPLDPRQLVLSAIDVLHLNDSHFSAGAVHQSEELGDPAYAPVWIAIGSHTVLGWNQDSNAVYLQYNPFVTFLPGLWPSGWAKVPVLADGLSMAQAKPGLLGAWPSGLPWWYTNVGDVFVGGKLYFDDLQASIDFDTGLGTGPLHTYTDLSQLADSTWGPFYARCAGPTSSVVCLTPTRGLSFTDATTGATTERHIDSDLRDYALASNRAGESSLFSVAGTNRYVGLADLTARLGDLGVRSTVLTRYTVLPR